MKTKTKIRRRRCEWANENFPERPAIGRTCMSWTGSCGSKGCERKKLEAQRRKVEQAQYRRFPGSPVQQQTNAEWRRLRDEQGGAAADAFHKGRTGQCSWCDGEIIDPKTGARSTRRRWHLGRDAEPDCIGDYKLHTDPNLQREAVIARDGRCCADCGAERGLEVDHDLALALVVIQIPEPERWRYWGMMNLKGRCSSCHAAKTREDVRKIRAARAGAPA